MIRFQIQKLAVSTSSVVWSQVRQFFVLEIYVLLTMMKNRVTQIIFNVLLAILSKSIVKQNSRVSQYFNVAQRFRVAQYNIVHKSTITKFTVSQVSHKHLYGASLQDNSLLRYTLYTSSVQDLHLPLRFLLQGQPYAFIQGYTLELSISY